MGAVITLYKTCSSCNGNGRLKPKTLYYDGMRVANIARRCRKCRGMGRVRPHYTISQTIPGADEYFYHTTTTFEGLLNKGNK